MAVRIETSAGPAAVCRVYRLEQDRVALDFNHPFAGEGVTLYLRILKMAPPGERSGVSKRNGPGVTGRG